MPASLSYVWRELTPTSGVAHPPVASTVPVACHHIFIVPSQEDTVGSKYHGDSTTAIYLCFLVASSRRRLKSSALSSCNAIVAVAEAHLNIG